jgi:glycerate kinase
VASSRAGRKRTLPYPRILIAPDKFKGTLSSERAAAAIARGVKRAWPKAAIACLGLTDGGEGFVEFMVGATRGRLRTTPTVDAAWRPRTAAWGVTGDGRTAVIGLTNASGIAHLPPNLRNPEKTSNLGTGLLIIEAIRKGYREILVGLGGSATNEGGISLASAIGYRFLDENGRDIPLDGGGLVRLARIEPPAAMPKARFLVATDVNNPLVGPKGASRQFAGQKGADAAMVARLEAGLQRLARIVKRDLGKDLAREPGAGAAGGCGYGLMAFFNAKRENGFEVVRRLTKLDALIRRHDLVITGEGCFDRTSLLGKAPMQLGLLARKMKRPVWALCGRVRLPISQSPFDRLAAVCPEGTADSAFDQLSAEDHAGRLERLALSVAWEASAQMD